MIRGRRVVSVALVGICLAAVGCGGSTSPSNSGGASSSHLIVVLMPSTTNIALAQWVLGAQKLAQLDGYTLKIIENNFDQSQQNQQVQQELGTSDKPVAYVWWPADASAGVISLRALAKTGVPIFMSNQYPPSDQKQYVKAYAGVNDTFNGTVGGQSLIKARDALLTMGVKLHGTNGNAVVLGFTPGYQAGIDRYAGFQQAIAGSGITILGKQDAGFDAPSGFKFMSELISADQGQGIDLVYAMNDQLAQGAIQALQAAGYKPGKNVEVVSATCHGVIDELTSGLEFASGVQPIKLEGELTLVTINKYLHGQKVPFNNFTPNPPIYGGTGPDNNIATVTVTGYDGSILHVQDVCVY